MAGTRSITKVTTISTRTVATAPDSSGRPKKKAKVELEEEVVAVEKTEVVGKQVKTTVTKARSKKAVSQEDESPQERVSSEWKVGAHVSAAGGVENAILNASKIGANSFALFLKSQRKWTSPALTEASIMLFKKRMQKYGYDSKHILPHGSYLINLGNPDAEKRKKGYDCFLDDLKRCEQLGLTLYNFHPGSTVGNSTPEESIRHIAECINRAHKETSTVIAVIENMAGAGNIIGSEFAHLKGIIDQVEDKSRIGVCLDTCHSFAASYDIRTKAAWDETLSSFDSIVGLSYLRGIHLNDSKTAFKSKKDRHDNIGMGHIGINAFHALVTDPRVQDIPLILETPNQEDDNVWKTEIDVLNRLSTMSEEEMAASGGKLVEEIKEVVKKAEKVVEAKKQKKGGAAGKGKRKKKDEDEDEDDEEDDD